MLRAKVSKQSDFLAAANHYTVLTNVTSESFVRLSRDADGGQNPAWPSMNGPSNHQYSQSMNFEPVLPDIFTDNSVYQQVQAQQVPHSRNSSNVDMFMDSSSSMHQVSVVAQEMPNDELRRQSNQFQPLYNGSQAPVGLSPDFLAGVSFGQKNYLSTYLGEMLSGGYMA